MIIVFCKSTWVKFTQVEKHIQIFAMFRNSATVKSNISVFIKKLNFRNNYREKISQTDRLNVTAKKTVTFVI